LKALKVFAGECFENITRPVEV